jgi:hypothetical protein
MSVQQFRVTRTLTGDPVEVGGNVAERSWSSIRDDANSDLDLAPRVRRGLCEVGETDLSGVGEGFAAVKVLVRQCQNGEHGVTHWSVVRVTQQGY